MSYRNRLRELKKKPVAIALAVLAATAAAASNVDTLASLWTKYVGDPSEFPVLEDAVNQPKGPLASSSVVLELVQAPKRQQDDQRLYDIYLRNTTGEDILLTNVRYGNGFQYTSAAPIVHSESGKFLPEASYTILVKGPQGENVALSPPYLLRSSSRGAIRFKFTRDGSVGELAPTLAFELFDATGRKVAAVNALRGRN
jgi:hypothetical protein